MALQLARYLNYQKRYIQFYFMRGQDENLRNFRSKIILSEIYILSHERIKIFEFYVLTYPPNCQKQISALHWMNHTDNHTKSEKKR